VKKWNLISRIFTIRNSLNISFYWIVSTKVDKMEHAYLTCSNNKEYIQNVIRVRQQRIQLGKPTITCAWPRGLGRGYAAARLLRSWVRIQSGAWIFVCCDCRVLSGRGLCDKLITRPEESYRPWRVDVCDLETLWMRRPWPTGGYRAENEKKKQTLRCGNDIEKGLRESSPEYVD
jgi:hypothetical protein